MSRNIYVVFSFLFTSYILYSTKYWYLPSSSYGINQHILRIGKQYVILVYLNVNSIDHNIPSIVLDKFLLTKKEEEEAQTIIEQKYHCKYLNFDQ